METKRTDFDNILQDVNKVKKYANDLQTFIGVNKMTCVVYGEVKKQKGAINYDLFEMKLDFSSELKSFIEDVSKFGVVSVTTKHCSTSLVKKSCISSRDSTGKQAGCYTTTHKKDDCRFST